MWYEPYTQPTDSSRGIRFNNVTSQTRCTIAKLNKTATAAAITHRQRAARIDSRCEYAVEWVNNLFFPFVVVCVVVVFFSLFLDLFVVSFLFVAFRCFFMPIFVPPFIWFTVCTLNSNYTIISFCSLSLVRFT